MTAVFCAQCDDPFTRPTQRGRPRLYCAKCRPEAKREASRQWALNHYRSNRRTECVWCFHAEIPKGRAKYCSVGCAYAANKHQASHPIDRCEVPTCRSCGLANGGRPGPNGGRYCWLCLRLT
jgi:hypothetical protein